MINQDIIERLRAFIKDNYILQSAVCYDIEPMVQADHMEAPAKVQRHAAAMVQSLSAAVTNVNQFIRDKQEEDTFAIRLKHKMQEKKMTPKELYSAADIDRRLFSKINTDKDYHPTKSTAIALGMALHLDNGEMTDLLDSAGFTLTNTSITDLVILFCIENKIYNIMDVNSLLFETGEKPLGRDLE
jgi:hypothetical protein